MRHGLDLLFFSKRSQSFLLYGKPRWRDTVIGALKSEFPNNDYLSLMPEKGAITLESVRKQVLPLLTLKREASGPGLILVIDRAESLTAAAQNLLLKTVEEPAPGSYIIFAVARPDGSLLPTLLSRLTAYDAEHLCQELGLKPVESNVTERYLALSGGDYRLAEELANGGEFDEYYRLLSSPLSEALKQVRASGMDGAKAKLLINLALTITRHKLAKAAGPKELGHWLEVQQRCLRIRSMLDYNVNPVLAADGIILAFHSKL